MPRTYHDVGNTEPPLDESRARRPAGAGFGARSRYRMGTRKKRLSAEERREQILEVGLRVFADKGFDATTLDQVAAAAKVSKPIIYDYFENKQAFIDAIVEREAELIAERLLTALDPELDVPLITQGVTGFFEYLQERPDGFRAVTGHAPVHWGGSDRRSKWRRRFLEERVNEVRELLERVGDATDPEVFTHFAIGALTFVGEYWLSARPRPSLDNVVQQTDQLLRFGLPASSQRRPSHTDAM